MANWTEVINISHLHRLYEAGKISIPQLGKTVAKRLQATSFFQICEPEYIDIMCEFEALDEFSELKDYETALDLLYDFGDKNNNIWVETFEATKADDIEIHPPIKTLESVGKDEHSIRIPINVPPTIYGPYYNRNDSVIASYMNTNTTHSRYNRFSKTTRYLSKDDFNKRLVENNVDPNTLPKEMYEYMKDADDNYQAWLIECLPNLHVAEIKPCPQQQ